MGRGCGMWRSRTRRGPAAVAVGATVGIEDPANDAILAVAVALVGRPDHVEEAGKQVREEHDDQHREDQPEVLVLHPFESESQRAAAASISKCSRCPHRYDPVVEPDGGSSSSKDS